MQDSIQTQAVVRTILARLIFKADDVFKKVQFLSGGERIKVSFAKLFVSDANILLLDEPTNYLDMQSIEALESVLKDYEGTVVFVSHDSTFVNAIADRIIIFENGSMKAFEGTLEEYKQSQQKVQAKAMDGTEKIILEMKISEIVAKLSNPNADKEALEAEYQSLILKLRSLK